MATLEESIAVDMARWRDAGVTWLEIAHRITAMPQIKEGLELRSEKMRKQAGRGLG